MLRHRVIPALLLSTTREKIKSNPEQVVRFLRAMNNSMNLIRTEPDRAVEDARKQRYGGDFKAEREALKQLPRDRGFRAQREDPKLVGAFCCQ